MASLRTGTFLSYAGGFREAVEDVVELEKIGVDIALVAEAYSFDAISQLGYLAAKTSRIELGTGVVPIYVRTPSLLGEYTSQGMYAGDIPDTLRDRSFPWWFEYVELYKNFLHNREQYPILKEPAIIEEAKNIKDIFLTKYRKETPRILSDIPHLYTEEKGMQLGEFLF